MYAWSDLFLIALVLTNFLLLGSSRLGVYIRVASVQGVALGLLPLFVHGGEATSLARLVPLWAMGLVTIGVKGVLFPILLTRAQRAANVNREIEPRVSFPASVLVGLAALGLALRIGARLPQAESGFSTMSVPVGLFTLFVGLFLIIARRKALTQVLGYLVLENGAYILGLAMVAEIPVLVEAGVLLDAFVAVFVMQIAIHQITAEFRSTDVDKLTALRG